MANGKNGRKKTLTTVVVIIVLVIASIFGIDVTQWFSTDSGEETTITQQGTSSEGKESGEQVIQNAEGQLILTMIDVGQADSFFFQKGEDTALIDCGTRSTGDDVVAYLKELGITQIDYVFGTHPHDDHMGGMYDVITSFEIGEIIIPEVEDGVVTANWYMKLMNEIKNGDYNVEYAELGSIYTLDGDVTFKIIGPVEQLTGNINNYSIVQKVTFGEMDIIMTGDAEVEIEKQILMSGENLDTEIYKVGHHGSDTSNSDEFLDAVSPDYALISCKTGNKYNHPVKSVMDKLSQREIEVYRTDENGTVTLIITPTDVTFDCEPGDYLSGPELEE